MLDMLIGNGTVVTLGAQNQLIEQGAVLVRDSRIAAIDTDATLRRQRPDAEYIDAHGGLIMPGFLCTHTHFYSAFARGLTIAGEPPRNFPEILERLWWRLDKLLTLVDTRASAAIFLSDAKRLSMTFVIDHQTIPYSLTVSLAFCSVVAVNTGIGYCIVF